MFSSRTRLRTPNGLSQGRFGTSASSKRCSAVDRSCRCASGLSSRRGRHSWPGWPPIASDFRFPRPCFRQGGVDGQDSCRAGHGPRHTHRARAGLDRSRLRSPVVTRYSLFPGEKTACQRERHVRQTARVATERFRAEARKLAGECLLSLRKSERPDIEPVLHSAYLVPRRSVPTFLELINQAGKKTACLRLESTGPWPPSHFLSAIRP